MNETQIYNHLSEIYTKLDTLEEKLELLMAKFLSHRHANVRGGEVIVMTVPPKESEENFIGLLPDWEVVHPKPRFIDDSLPRTKTEEDNGK